MDRTRTFGSGRYRACLVALWRPQREIERLLPIRSRGQVSLAACPWAPPGMHPLVLSIGEQQEVSAPWWPGPRTSYGETIAMVPWVQSRIGLVTVPIQLWLDKWPPVWLGRLWSVPKARVPMRVSMRVPMRVDEGRVQIPGRLQANWVALAPKRRPAELSWFRTTGLRAGMGQPLLGFYRKQPHRVLVRWHHERSWLQPARLTLQTSGDWLPLPPLDIDGIAASAQVGAACVMDYYWTIKFPGKLPSKLPEVLR